MGDGLHVCGYVRCGRAFDAPVRLTDFSHRPRSRTYYACPYCFSKLNQNWTKTKHLHREDCEISDESLEISIGGLKTILKDGEQKVAEKAGTCVHQFGYLKARSKNEAIPDDCLTCPKILQCML